MKRSKNLRTILFLAFIISSCTSPLTNTPSGTPSSTSSSISSNTQGYVAGTTQTYKSGKTVIGASQNSQGSTTIPNAYASPQATSVMMPPTNYYPSATQTTSPSGYTGTTSDIKERATFNGRAFDKNGNPLEGAIVTAKSVDVGVSWVGEATQTSGGAYVFRNAPVGARIEVTITKDGFSKTRSEVLKSNLNVDPTANTFDFGFNGTTGSTDPNNFYVLPDGNDSRLLLSFDSSITFTTDTLITVEYFDVVSKKTRVISKYYGSDWSPIENIANFSSIKITVKKPDGSTKSYDYALSKKDNKIKLSNDSFTTLALINEELQVDSSINHFIYANTEHLSTFSTDVDTASYTLMKKTIMEQNALPKRETLRTEEFLNYFDYKYQEPTDASFNINTDLATSPVGPTNRKLFRIGLQSKSISDEARKSAFLTFVIDISGSMQSEDRLPTVKKTLKLLVNNLQPEDKVGIVVFGDNSRVLLEHKSITSKQEILNAIDSVNVEGSTNTEAGLIEGFKLASKYYKSNANNRVILCSDGLANVGIVDPDKLVNTLKSYSKGLIGLSTVGFGITDYNDVMMETLSDKGNGYYAYVDNMQEAYRVFWENLSGSLQNFARDVKVQVDFNPAVVKRYRLLGYENRKLNNADFRNDSVDAGEVGINTSVTALYELELNDYDTKAQAKIGQVNVRYKEAKANKVNEQKKEFFTSSIVENFNQTSASFKLASSVAMFAEILKGSYWAQYASYTDVINMAKDAEKNYPNYDQLKDFIYLAQKASNINGSSSVYYKNDQPVTLPNINEIKERATFAVKD